MMTMEEITSLSDSEFDAQALRILAKELGPGGFARYLDLHREKKGSYTEERREAFGLLSAAQILSLPVPNGFQDLLAKGDELIARNREVESVKQ